MNTSSASKISVIENEEPSEHLNLNNNSELQEAVEAMQLRATANTPDQHKQKKEVVEKA